MYRVITYEGGTLPAPITLVLMCILAKKPWNHTQKMYLYLVEEGRV